MNYLLYILALSHSTPEERVKIDQQLFPPETLAWMDQHDVTVVPFSIARMTHLGQLPNMNDYEHSDQTLDGIFTRLSSDNYAWNELSDLDFSQSQWINFNQWYKAARLTPVYVPKEAYVPSEHLQRKLARPRFSQQTDPHDYKDYVLSLFQSQYPSMEQVKQLAQIIKSQRIHESKERKRQHQRSLRKNFSKQKSIPKKIQLPSYLDISQKQQQQASRLFKQQEKELNNPVVYMRNALKEGKQRSLQQRLQSARRRTNMSNSLQKSQKRNVFASRQFNPALTRMKRILYQSQQDQNIDKYLAKEG